MKTSITKGGLKKGFSTGAVSAAAVKASIRYYFLKKDISSIEIEMPLGETCSINIFSLSFKILKSGEKAACTVIEKYSGDDPDVTGGIKIHADFLALKPLKCNENFYANYNGEHGNEYLLSSQLYGKIHIYNEIHLKDKDIRLILTCANGIGIVTKPGLPVNIGAPAINPVPYKMIEDSAKKELLYWADITGQSGATFLSVLYIPEGEKVAKKTLNSRLGIIGGLSILGTTGYVIPISASAWLGTIKSSLMFLSANNRKVSIYIQGRFSEKKAMEIFGHYAHEHFIEIGDFVSYSMRKAMRFGMKEIILVGQFGKILKISQGARNTNAKYTTINLKYLAEAVKRRVSDERLYEMVANSNTSREAFFHILDKTSKEASKNIIYDILKSARSNLERMGGGSIKCTVVLLSYDGKKLLEV